MSLGTPTTAGRPASSGCGVAGGPCANAPAVHQNHAAKPKQIAMKRLREVIVDILVSETAQARPRSAGVVPGCKSCVIVVQEVLRTLRCRTLAVSRRPQGPTPAEGTSSR